MVGVTAESPSMKISPISPVSSANLTIEHSVFLWHTGVCVQSIGNKILEIQINWSLLVGNLKSTKNRLYKCSGTPDVHKFCLKHTWLHFYTAFTSVTKLLRIWRVFSRPCKRLRTSFLKTFMQLRLKQCDINRVILAQDFSLALHIMQYFSQSKGTELLKKKR